MTDYIGKYEILETIATGAQGVVYKAKDSDLDRIIAVKVLRAGPDQLESLKSEARLAASLEHPAITTIYDYSIDDDISYIAMEFVPDSLGTQLINSNGLSWQRAVEIASQVAMGLNHAHDRGIIHRDIKPYNILLTESGEVRIADFGIAKALLGTGANPSTGFKGTPSYVAPEQWSGGAIDGRLDQYALGIVLYQMLTGSIPFKGNSVEEIYVQHRDANLPGISPELGVPIAVRDIVKRATLKVPEERYASMWDMIVDLQAASGVTATKLTSNVGQEDPKILDGSKNIWFKHSKNLWLVVLSLMVLVLGVVVTLKGFDYGLVNDNRVVNEPLSVDKKPISIISPGKTDASIVDSINSVITAEAFPHFSRGNEHRDNGNYPLAIEAYSLAIEIDEKFPDPYFERGRLYEELGRLNDAQSDFTDACILLADFCGKEKISGASNLDFRDTSASLNQFERPAQVTEATSHVDPINEWKPPYNVVAKAKPGGNIKIAWNYTSYPSSTEQKFIVTPSPTPTNPCNNDDCNYYKKIGISDVELVTDVLYPGAHLSKGVSYTFTVSVFDDGEIKATSNPSDPIIYESK